MISALFTIGTTVAMLWMSVRLARAERKFREAERGAAGLRSRAFDEGFLAGVSQAAGLWPAQRGPEPAGGAGSSGPEETRAAGGAR